MYCIGSTLYTTFAGALALGTLLLLAAFAALLLGVALFAVLLFVMADVAGEDVTLAVPALLAFPEPGVAAVLVFALVGVLGATITLLP